MHAVTHVQYQSETLRTATVTQAKDGEAVQVRSHDGTLANVNAHTSMAPFIEQGDQVVCMPTEGDEHLGVMVVDRVRRPGEAPAKAFADYNGQLVLETDKDIIFKALNSQLALTGDGKIALTAENILSLAKVLNCIQGHNIELN